MDGRSGRVTWCWSAWRALGSEVENAAALSLPSARFLLSGVLENVERLADGRDRIALGDEPFASTFVKRSVVHLSVYCQVDARGIVVLAVRPDASELQSRWRLRGSGGYSLSATLFVSASRALHALARRMTAEAAFLRSESSTMGLPEEWSERFEDVAAALATTGYDLDEEIEELHEPDRLALSAETRRGIDSIDRQCIDPIQAHVQLVSDLEREKGDDQRLGLAWSLAACCGANLLTAHNEARRAADAYREAFDQALRGVSR